MPGAEGVEGVHRRFYDTELADRASRPLGDDRERQVREFARRCVAEDRRKVLEVGCGAGRDGRVIADAGLAYAGVDLSPVGARICRDAGLGACAASALALPFADDTFDAGWSMSTLMHLDGDGMQRALAELRRVIGPGGVLEVGVWGKDVDDEWYDAHGRYFRHRTDRGLRQLLGAVGEVTAFATWDHLDDGGAHYQWARVAVGATP
ncbi:class I SAM-dependent methyltransferase [Nocardioides sp. CER19]|uniref:class I SAM-dependent methyltransferase n=1 Tax=Nocardioides sp. CER19 TaxID=3038538 RepID=UPI00244B8FAC|nr:class I SAM-dependent methyltransferase [Nocardioides sp. CER19]MDH2413017.1 class I SAM-dependent methyltransferase [Nocardioides sp. CER19]